MPSPDQSSYTTLVLYDRDPYALVQAALTDAVTKLPGFSPKVGSLEMVLIESLALIVSELVYAVNRLPNGVFDILMQLFGINRSLGNPPSSTATFTAVDTLGHTVPTGVQVRLSNGADDSIVFQTTQAGVISPGSASVTVPITATTNTDDYNGTVSGTELLIATPIAFGQSAQLASVVSGGESAETDDEWRDRVIELYKTLNSALVLPSQFTAKALALPGVYRANTKDNWNIDTSATGHVTIAVADNTGQPLGDTPRGVIETTLDGLAQAALTVHVVNPDYNEIDVQVNVVVKAGYVAASVQASVLSALNDYLSPTNWPWAGAVRINELVSLVDQVEGVDYVPLGSLQIGVDGGGLADSDITLTGPFPLVMPGELEVLTP